MIPEHPAQASVAGEGSRDLDPPRSSGTSGWLVRVALGLLVLGLAAGLRVRQRTSLAIEGQGLATLDADGHYHMRRVQRALVEGEVATQDPLMSTSLTVARPELGAPIPWPGAATHVLAFLVRPFVLAEASPEDQRHEVERLVGSSAALFASLLAALVVVWFLGREVGPGRIAGALVAGLVCALAPASLRYSHVGMGDHHSLASLLAFGATAALLAAFRAGGTWRVLLASGLSALALGIWLPLLFLPILLGTLAGSRKEQRRRACSVLLLSAGFALPMGVNSPWPPGALLEPSGAQSFLLGLTAAGILLRGRESRRLGLGVLILVTLAGGLCGVLQGLAHELGRAIAWGTGRDAFMAGIAESRSPLAHPLDLMGLLAWTGPGLLLALLGGRVRRDLDPFTLLFLALLGAGVLQARFTELLVPFMAVSAGRGTQVLITRAGGAGRVLALGLPALLLVAHLPTLQAHAPRTSESPTLRWHRGVRAACEWLHLRGEGAVLAQWDLGHTLEWVGERKSVANNFGSYLGEEAFLAPWRLWASTTDAAASELLDRWGVQHVLWTSRWQRNEEPWALALELEEIPQDALVRRAETLEALPGFLRLVHESPLDLRDRVHSTDAEPLPIARVFEVVPGARLVGTGLAGETLQVTARLRPAGAGRDLAVSFEAEVGLSGKATVRVPYSSAPHGSSVTLVGPLRWRLGSRGGTIELSEEQVRQGVLVPLP